MGRCGKAAFTLTELLMVIAIVLLLVGLLMPAAGGAWQALFATHCRHNLVQIWKAYYTWQSDMQFALLTPGAGWRAVLGPYVENRETIFRCPAALQREGGCAVLADLTFKMWSNGNGYGFTTGEFLGTAVVEECGGVRLTQVSTGKMLVEIEDRWFFVRPDVSHWHGGYDDVRFYVYYEASVPVRVEVIGGDQGTGSSYSAFRYDFYYGDQLLLADFVRYPGRVVQLPGLGVICDYGLSAGCYSGIGPPPTRLDARLFFMVDHPEPLADYRAAGQGQPWDKHFWRDEREWIRKYGDTLWNDETPRHYQSLRHFGMANVLFCDGHVETIGLSADAEPDRLLDGHYLDEQSPLWRYGAL